MISYWPTGETVPELTGSRPGTASHWWKAHWTQGLDSWPLDQKLPIGNNRGKERPSAVFNLTV